MDMHDVVPDQSVQTSEGRVQLVILDAGNTSNIWTKGHFPGGTSHKHSDKLASNPQPGYLQRNAVTAAPSECSQPS
ncbi:hypothetical protein LSH36_939g00036 [Paralvinella palmiformis]|uniref:Uncharacterized protein n=1 Tax=Paralvinella palmiformis TaxID=53620 RepID=A0AAD9MRA5_9ANNE|nr:hypothetical protein LSH36_939g00036 [Paralvinella palmiformis]